MAAWTAININISSILRGPRDSLGNSREWLVSHENVGRRGLLATSWVMKTMGCCC